MKQKSNIYLAICLLVLSAATVEAIEYKAAVKQFAMSNDFVNLITAMVEATGNTVKIEVVPSARADYLVSTKEVDFQYPSVASPGSVKSDDDKYDYSTAVIAQIPFILYTNKAKPVAVDSLKKGNPNNYLIEVDISRAADFTFKVGTTSNYDASFAKLSDGKIDGLILGQPSGDPLLKKAGYKNIARQVWVVYDQCFSLQRGARGSDVDKMLSEGLRLIKASGSFDKIIGAYVNSLKFDNWQP